MKNQLVSIVTPSFNQVHFLKHTIDSVLQQDYSPIEYIVTDGGSTDGSVELLKTYGNKINWVSEKDKGQSDGINKGFRKAKGEIIGWINSDDTYELGAVRKAVEFLQKNPDVDVIYSDCNIILKDGRNNGIIRTQEFDMYKQLNHGNIIPQPTAFFRRKVFDEIGYLDEKLHYAMDYDFWTRIGKKLKIKKMNGEILANFRMYPESKSISHYHLFWPEIYEISLRNGGERYSRMYFFHYLRWMNKVFFGSPLYPIIRDIHLKLR
jgi:glycosyltransferase involved in cell wall biosynthesis